MTLPICADSVRFAEHGDATWVPSCCHAGRLGLSDEFAHAGACHGIACPSCDVDSGGRLRKLRMRAEADEIIARYDARQAKKEGR
jgi:hypothetical protein